MKLTINDFLYWLILFVHSWLNHIFPWNFYIHTSCMGLMWNVMSASYSCAECILNQIEFSEFCLSHIYLMTLNFWRKRGESYFSNVFSLLLLNWVCKQIQSKICIIIDFFIVFSWFYKCDNSFATEWSNKLRQNKWNFLKQSSQQKSMLFTK